jgi:ribosomal protein S18 acetylase RimI-like enzyme
LLTEHARFALGAGLARRYPADVIPFAGVADPTPEAATALAGLMASGEDIYVLDPFPSANRDLLEIGELPCWQMIFDRAGGPLPTIEPSRTAAVRALGKADVPAMVALTDRAFPGFFRARTFELGRYYGIHVDGVLVAMAGQRLALPGCRELSAVCTHPEHTGRGYAALLVNQLLQLHAAAGLCSFLHVAAVNARAIALYERAGFAKTREIVFRRLKRRYEP